MPGAERSRGRARRAPDRTSGSSAQDRAQWRQVYESSPFEELPWFEPGPSPALVDAAERGFLPATGATLDIGCGAGSNVLWLARRGYEAYGIDLSPGAVAAARQRAAQEGLRLDVREGDALALGFPARRFDFALDHGCFHTLPVDRRADYTSEVARVLRPEGGFLLCWIAREHTAEHGPPHRPSLAEVAAVFEGSFLFRHTEFRPGDDDHLPSYAAWLERRSLPQPPPR